MSAGYSGTPLPRKLGIEEGAEVGTVAAPKALGSLLEPMPAGVRVRKRLGRGPYDVLLIFVATPEELTERFTRAKARMKREGSLWVCWPKLSSDLAGSLRESDVREHGLSEGLVDNKVCAIDDDWSGLRFVVRLRDR